MEITTTKEDVERGMRNEEKNEKMNLYNTAHKATNQNYRDGYDQIRWDNPEEERDDGISE